jgi:hypothetical protein
MHLQEMHHNFSLIKLNRYHRQLSFVRVDKKFLIAKNCVLPHSFIFFDNVGDLKALDSKKDKPQKMKYE